MNAYPGMAKERFEADYNAQPPWCIGKPQQAFIDRFAGNPPASPVLDVGCGFGDLAVFLASLGCEVEGVDFSAGALQQARRTAAAAQAQVRFTLDDATTLQAVQRTFYTAVDSCFFHLLDDMARRQYVAAISRCMPAGAMLYMLNIAVDVVADDAPRIVQQDIIEAVFAPQWELLECQPSVVELTSYKRGIPAIFACLRRGAALPES